MKTDSIFYRLFQEFPDLFFELIGVASNTANAYNFTSVEVKQTAFRIDGVFLPKQGEEHPIYFAEVQFQVDLEIYSRLFSEVNLYLRQNKPTNDWRGVVVYPSSNIDRANTLHYHECFESQRVTCIYLNELGDNTSLPIGVATIKLIVEEGDSAIAPARELIVRSQQANIPEVQQQKLLRISKLN